MPPGEQVGRTVTFPDVAAEPRPLILTLALEPALARPLDRLRTRYFPPERNFLAAHVTLFHALPGEHEARVRKDLAAVCSGTPAFTALVPRLGRWSGGVYAELESPALLGFREHLAARWHDLLTPQDRRAFRPHVALQNKVSAARAAALHAELAPAWRALSGRATGAELWFYAGGPWAQAASFGFVGRAGFGPL